jgi:hypothetical protein
MGGSSKRFRRLNTEALMSRAGYTIKRRIVMSKKDLSSTSRTNWAALESRSEENIDYSDIPPLTDDFFERATLRVPADQAHNLVQLDPDVKQ